MSKPGPSKTPTAIKIARGTLRNKLKTEPDPQTGPMRIPTWANFGKHGKTLWADTLKRLPEGVAAATDIQMLVAYCKAWERFLDAEDILAKEGRYHKSQTGLLHPHPAIRDYDSARAEIRRLAGLFGLSPADRASMGVSAAKKQTVRKRKRA